jgi:hypothetical protein
MTIWSGQSAPLIDGLANAPRAAAMEADRLTE